MACWVSDGAVTSVKALQPGDANYPMRNPAPRQEVQFISKIPDGWPAEFRLKYHVVAQQQGSSGTFVSPSGCAWNQHSQFYVDLPIQLERQGELYKGKFAVDHFLPGDCKWGLKDFTSPIVRSSVAYHSISMHPNAHPFPDLDLAKEKLNIWCTKHGKSTKRSEALRDQYDCTPFGMIEIFIGIPAGFKETIPKDQQEWPHIFTQYLRSMTVEIHDLDQMIADYVNRNSEKPATGS